jgi:glycosyltransferase involved in cell wall biosynthesis
VRGSVAQATAGNVERPRIAHVIDGLGAGGAEALLVTNLKNLSPTKQHFVVKLFRPMARRYRTTSFWESAIVDLGVPVVALECAGARDLGRAAYALARWLRAERIGVVHSHLFYANIVAAVAARAARLPLVSSLHTLSYEPEVVATYREPRSWRHTAAQAVESAVLRASSDRVIAVGERVASSAVDRLALDPARVVVVHNPVDLVAIDATTDADVAAVRAELSLPIGARLLVLVGRVMPSKRQLDAVEALKALSSDHPTAHLALVGPLADPSYATKVREAAGHLGLTNRVHLLGGRRDIPAWLRAADVFVFPTEYEGLPVALAEATAAGCACVASDIGPNREVIAAPRGGLLVPVGDTRAIGRSVSGLLADDATRRAMGRAASERSRALFSPTQAAARLDRIYDDLLAH